MKLVFSKDEALAMLKEFAFSKDVGDKIITDVEVHTWSHEEFLIVKMEDAPKVTGFQTQVQAEVSTELPHVKEALSYTVQHEEPIDENAQAAVEATVKEDLPL